MKTGTVSIKEQIRKRKKTRAKRKNRRK